MPEFKFAVTETRNVEMHYTIIADTEAEAREMAEAGETVDETEISITGVTDRYVSDLIKPLETNPNCKVGVHSWAHKIGKLPADTTCDHCDEEYGNPD